MFSLCWIPSLFRVPFDCARFCSQLTWTQIQSAQVTVANLQLDPIGSC
jgi:hypothetical protein